LSTALWRSHEVAAKTALFLHRFPLRPFHIDANMCSVIPAQRKKNERGPVRNPVVDTVASDA